MELYFITSNKQKANEFQNLLGTKIKIKNLNIVEIQGTPEEIVIDKVKKAFNIIKKPCIVEDTNVGFKDWDWLPGVYAKEFIKRLGYKKISQLLENKDKTAKFTTYIAYAKSEKKIIVIKGTTMGQIVKPRKNNGFGYDPIFLPKGEKKTYSEMSIEEKNKISQRYKAIKKLKAILK